MLPVIGDRNTASVVRSAYPDSIIEGEPNMVSQGQGDQVSVRQFTGGKKWILSVDDEPAILYMREILLQTEGYEVLSAADGEHALTIFDAQPIDLVLLDYLMPGMDGSAVAEFTTDDQGKFRVSLPPGHYSVTKKNRQKGIGRYGPFDIDVVAGQMTKVEWQCDTGMR